MKVTRTPAAFEKMQKAVQDLQAKSLRVGFFDSAKYEDGTPVAYVATIHEFGSPSNGIPARPFMRPAIAENKTQWAALLGAGSKRVLSGKMEVDQMLGQVGMQAAGEVSESIAAVSTPALKPSTIAARAAKRATPGASTKPLVDTGLMIQSVSHKVEG